VDLCLVGERYGRHWLDVARYADSAGFEYDVHRPNAWRYRDYVIRQERTAGQLAALERDVHSRCMAEIVTDGDDRFAPRGEGDDVVSGPRGSSRPPRSLPPSSS
jgi:hypothetical protein